MLVGRERGANLEKVIVAIPLQVTGLSDIVVQPPEILHLKCIVIMCDCTAPFIYDARHPLHMLLLVIEGAH